jgi:hypothetical protein
VIWIFPPEGRAGASSPPRGLSPPWPASSLVQRSTALTGAFLLRAFLGRARARPTVDVRERSQTGEGPILPLFASCTTAGRSLARRVLHAWPPHLEDLDPRPPKAWGIDGGSLAGGHGAPDAHSRHAHRNRLFDRPRHAAGPPCRRRQRALRPRWESVGAGFNEVVEEEVSPLLECHKKAWGISAWGSSRS